MKYADESNENILIYYEVPGRDHSLKYAHKYAMGATAAIFVFDGKCKVRQLPVGPRSSASKAGLVKLKRQISRSSYSLEIKWTRSIPRNQY